MDEFQKLKILGTNAKYDVSCGGTKNEFTSLLPGIYRSKKGDGGCSSLLKILMTNYCEYDCAYCINRKSNNVVRTIFTPDEICKITLEFYKKEYIDGLFLSSGILKNPDFTMELMLQAVRKLRKVYNFLGYIHLKIMPGSDFSLIDEAIKLASRVSVNLEMPSRDNLHKFCPQKNEKEIFNPMRYIADKINELKEKKIGFFGQTTQLIIGATNDTDYDILKLSSNLYEKVKLKRVYYSAFSNVNYLKDLPENNEELIKREHRLYQSDWLLRVYGYKMEEILPSRSNLNLKLDPKTEWALRNFNLFPVEVNRADYDELIRIPGIGIISAKKIIKARKDTPLNPAVLEAMGISLKKAGNFITINGKYYGLRNDNPQKLIQILSEKDVQPSLFEEV